MTTTAAIESEPQRCAQFDWCIEEQAGHIDHVWTDGIPANAQGQPGTVYVWARIYDTDEFPDDVLIGVGRADDQCWGAEGALTIENAEYLRDVLDKAIRYASRRQAADELDGPTGATDQRLALALQDMSAVRTALREVRQFLSSSRVGRAAR